MSHAEPPDPRIGTRIDGYRVVSVLGIGGMGRVYRAISPDGADVALKLVKEDFAADETFRRRFQREARAAQAVKHPNVVPVLDVGQFEGLPYIIERFVEGQALDVVLKAEPRLPVRRTVTICAEVADGLGAIWAAGLVHRDIKPANILLDAQDHPYITDFGLAKEIEGSLLTLPGQALGSIDYMSPEQIRGETVSAASDVYALGCVVFECLCGRPPFGHVQGMRILWAHLQDEPPNPSSLRPDLPPEVSLALLEALEKEADERPGTAGAFAQRLAAAAGVEIQRDRTA